MKKLLIIFIFAINSFAITPFSLEGFKEANVKLSCKSKAVSKEFKEELKKKVTTLLEKADIKTSTKEYSNFIVKIEILKIKKYFAVNCSIFIVEDIIPYRDQDLLSMGITYKKSDLFDTTEKELQNDIKESVLDYLLFDFLEQYDEENRHL
jgi:hypothetical protein